MRVQNAHIQSFSFFDFYFSFYILYLCRREQILNVVMTKEDIKRLKADSDGLLTYEYIANNIDSDELELDWLVDNVILVDLTGQFIASAARYLHAIGPTRYAEQISKLVDAAIGKDREHKYLPDLLVGIYGKDYQDQAETLSATDDNFRRIYKRLFPQGF